MEKTSIIKGISNFIKSWKKYGLKKTIEKWKYNYIMLETPQGIIKKRIWGGIGTISGLIIAMFIFLYKQMWYITIIMGFSALIVYANLKGDLKQLQTLKDLEKEFEEEKNV
jgi:hypothetical protein